ncbi:MAG: hypothetical protein FWG02_10450 [Holophagaceae bacterium]|nr:hypothetical protein [Holophagaceae bacterium]
MALFSFGKDKQKDEIDPTVLAYMEDAQRTKCPAMVIDPHKNEIPCSIVAVQEGAGTLQLQLHANLIGEKGAKITFVVIIDSMRIGGPSKIQEVKPGSAVIDIPASLELMERRKKQRAKINPREGTTCILLSGLFDGIGITGLADNMSENGARIKIEKALEIQTEKPIKITTRNTPNGQIFPILKISKIPRCVATLEGAAKLVYSEVQSGTTYIGITFEEMKSEFSKVINNFVSSRTSPPPNSLPPKARRFVDPEPPARQADTSPKDDDKDYEKQNKKEIKDTKDTKVVAPAPEKAMPASGDLGGGSQPGVAPIEQPLAESDAQVGDEKELNNDEDETIDLPQRPVPTPLQKLKRKARTIVLFGADEEILVKMLLAEGYGKVICPNNMEELLESLPQGGTGLLLLDMDMPLDECIFIAKNLLSHLEEPPPVILISENNQVGVGDTLEAQRSGISLLLPRPLKINDALFNKMEELMGI